MDTADSPTPKIRRFLWIEDELWLHLGLLDPIFQLRFLPCLVRPSFGLLVPRIWTGMQLVTILRVACGVIPSPRCALEVVNEIAHLGCKIINWDSTTIYKLGCNPELPLVNITIYYSEGLVASGGNWTFLMFLHPLRNGFNVVQYYNIMFKSGRPDPEKNTCSAAKRTPPEQW